MSLPNKLPAQVARVLLTDPIDPEATARLSAVATVRLLGKDTTDDIVAAAADAHIVIVRRSIPAELLDHAKDLRALIRHGAGLDFIPVEVASDRGVAVVNTPGVNATSVAEAAIGMLLCGARRIAMRDREVRAGRWKLLRGDAFTDREIRGRSIGLLGFGSIAREVARIAHFGFDMTVRATRRRSDSDIGFVEMVPLSKLLRWSDFLVIACPLNEETRGMIGEEEIALMPRGAGIVNIARGAILSESALVQALKSGHLSFAALDVLAEQPPQDDHPLLSLDSTVITPHVAGMTEAAVRRMSDLATEEAMRVLEGERPLHLVNSTVWQRIEARWLSN